MENQTNAAGRKQITFGYLAIVTATPRSRLLAAIKRRLIPEPQRVGRTRVYYADQVPEIRRALQQAGLTLVEDLACA